ncbi:MAG: lamin tail domain-containing protein [Verrucomicrobiales bacterium]
MPNPSSGPLLRRTFMFLAALALAAASASGRDSVVVFNEINYHPAGNNQALEWVELRNQQSVDVELSAWRMDGGIQFNFPLGTVIPRGGYLVIARDPVALQAATGFAGALGPFSGALNNGGEEIVLYSHNRLAVNADLSERRVMDRLAFADNQPWPAAPDGSGVTLAKRDPATGTQPPENWSWSARVGGTPGAPNFPSSDGSALAGVLLSEIGPATGEALLKVELRNTGASAVVLDDMVLSVSGDPQREHLLPSGTTLPPGEFLVIDQPIPFSDQDRLFLFSPDRQQVIDARQASATLRGLVTDGEFAGRWLVPDKPTFGAANSFALTDAIAINEIFYHAYPKRGIPGSPSKLGDVVLVPLGSTWRYFENVSGEGLPAGWAADPHPAWPSGLALLGRETVDLAEPFRTPLSFSREQVTYYFEAEFDFAGDANAGLTLRHYVDDGAIFNLNGFEMGRYNMADAVVQPDTLASPSVDNAGPVTVKFPNARPVPGLNRISVEVHQGTLGSSDIVFGVEVIGRGEVEPGTPGQAYVEQEEEWIELFNRGPGAVDLTGWKFAEGIDFEFPNATTLDPGRYLIVAKQPDALVAKHPGIRAFGPFGGRLSNEGERIVLTGAQGNPADEVSYHDSGRWPSHADAGGSSLELRDARAHNHRPEAWAASDESRRSFWQTYSYQGVAENNRMGNNVFYEFLLGMLDAGEFLLDDVSVVENPGGTAVEFIQNGTFQNDTPGAPAAKWRAVGTHGSHGRTVVVVDPDTPTNKCLRVVATGPTEDKHNKLETTFSNNERVQVGTEYRISFRAKWLAGSNQVNTRLYFNYLQKTSLLAVPDRWGTPGAANSMAVANGGPNYHRLRHEPAVPAANEPVTVSLTAEDPDGVASMTLHYGLEGKNFQQVPMTRSAHGEFAAVIPGYAAKSVVQFYIMGVDLVGAESSFPAKGPSSRALFKVNDGLARLATVHNLRVIMLAEDRAFLLRNTNRMSNDRLGATVIYDEKTVFHDVGIRLKGSAFGRYDAGHYGFNIAFDPDQRFRGVHGTLSIERSPPLKEILAKHLLTQAGGPAFSAYDDVGRIINPTESQSGPCLFAMGRHTAEFWEGQFGPDSDAGTLFNHELLYNPNATSGGVEGLKVNNPYNHTNGRYDFIDRGDDKEPYRWGFQIRSQLGRDDFSAIIGASKAMALTGEGVEAAAAEFIDIDQWARAFAALSLVGNDDTYTRQWEHNLRYYQRPTDGKLIVLPWDLDRAFQLTATDAPIGGNNVGRFLKRPMPTRLFFSHARDMIETTFNTSYASRWSDHFGALTGSSYRTEATLVGNRANFFATRYPAKLPFEITTNGGLDFSVATPSVALRGSGWIDVRSIRRSDGAPLAVRWINSNTWEITAALQQGENVFALEAFDHRDKLVGTDSIRVTGTAGTSAPSAENLAISEIHYRPANPTPAELAAGYADASAFEFLELLNIGSVPVDLSGSRFAAGIEFAFPSNSPALAPGGRVVLVANQAAFLERYGDAAALNIAQFSGSLSNGGETLRLEDSTGGLVLEVAYGDGFPWPKSPDGSGPSLVLVAPETAPDPNNPLRWRPSTAPGGNPGTSDRIPFTGDSASLLDYALFNPAVTLECKEGLLTIAYAPRPGADSAAITIESSTDLTSWVAVSPDVLVGRTELPNGASQWLFLLSNSTEKGTARFARLRVTLR